MRLRSRAVLAWLSGPLFAVAALTFPSLIALYAAASHRRADAPWWWAAEVLLTLGVSIALASGLLAVYHRRLIRRLIHIALLTILLELFYRFAYHGPVSPGLLLSVPETSPRETVELLAGHLTLTWSLSLVMFATAASAVLAWRSPLKFPMRRCAAAAGIGALMMSAGLLVSAIQLGGVRLAAAHLGPQLQGLYPFDLASALSAVGRAWADNRRLSSLRSSFAFPQVHPTQAAAAAGLKQVYVIVVGETSRRANWSLYGYGRDTSPRLNAIKSDLFLFDHATSNATNTILSLPLTLTRASPAEPDRARAEKSILALLRQGGFETHWISNQDRADVISNAINQIALDAQFISYTADLPVAERQGGLDSNLIDRLAATIKAAPAEAKLAILLHMEGSHFGYKDRYPASFDRFGRAQRQGRALQEWQARLVDEYDNSILFNDSNLRDIIDSLASCQCRAGLIFFSDHGEKLFEGGAGDAEFGHGFPTVSREEIEVPLFLWLSEAYRASNPALVDQLKANAGRSVQLHNVFETIVDLAGLDYAGREANLSLFSDHLQPPTQLDVLNLQQQRVLLPAR